MTPGNGSHVAYHRHPPTASQCTTLRRCQLLSVGGTCGPPLPCACAASFPYRILPFFHFFKGGGGPLPLLSGCHLGRAPGWPLGQGTQEHGGEAQRWDDDDGHDFDRGALSWEGVTAVYLAAGKAEVRSPYAFYPGVALR